MCVCGITQLSSGEAVEGITANMWSSLTLEGPRINIIPRLLVMIGDLTQLIRSLQEQKLCVIKQIIIAKKIIIKLVEKYTNRKESRKVPSKEY